MNERWSRVPICIAGMHRSGTSTVAQLLNRCGLYLGQEDKIFVSGPDNPDGYWEHKEFRAINERILSTYGGGWDLPPSLSAGWQEGEQLDPLKVEVEHLLRGFEGYEYWGWKDPRNSLTLPFWMSLLPEIKVVICVRNPLEVALSLRRRAMSSRAFALNLWWIYNRSLLDALPEASYVVTHYETYFYRPTVELRRVLDALGVPASDQLVARARSTTMKDLRHHRMTTRQLLEANVPHQLIELYERLCQLAGWNGDHPTFLSRTVDHASGLPPS